MAAADQAAASQVTPKAALIFPTLGLDIGMTRAGLELAWSLGSAADSFVTKGLTRIYKKAPAYADLVNFPYKLKQEDLRADVWLTGNALPCVHALRRVKALGLNAHPSYVLAHLPSMEDAPSMIRAWRETRLFAQIEWTAEPCWAYACHVDQKQYFLCGTTKSAREVKLPRACGGDAGITQPNDLIAWGRDGSWNGPLKLDPKGDDGQPIGIINTFRHGAVSQIVSSLLATLAGGDGLRDYDESGAFAQFKPDEKAGIEVIAKLTDGGIQRLLDGSMENFYDFWPENGCCLDSGLLIRRERGYESSIPGSSPFLPSFESARNVSYIAAMLGLPEYWLPT
jgi:hypothetical protein